MKYVKMLGLLAVAAAALMAFVGTASATTLTSSSGTTPTIEATSSNSKLDGSFVTVECSHSQVKGTVTSHGASVTVAGHISTLDFTGCNYAVTVEEVGTLEVHPKPTTGNGTLTSKGSKITIHTSVGSCTFTTNAVTGTEIGELTGSNHTGSNAVLDINSSKIPRTGGNFLCGSSGTWTGNYTVTSPSSLEVH